MEQQKLEALKARFADVKLTPNAKTMDEVVEYIEKNWGAERVKILESEYVAHYRRKSADTACRTKSALCWVCSRNI